MLNMKQKINQIKEKYVKFDNVRKDYVEYAPVLDYVVCLNPANQHHDNVFSGYKKLQKLDLRRKFKQAVIRIIKRNREISGGEKANITNLVANLRKHLAEQYNDEDSEVQQRLQDPVTL